MGTAPRTKRVKDDEDIVAPPAQSTPQGYGGGYGGHDFTLQAIMDLQKNVGEMNANLLAMKGSVDGMKAKVDDLIGWKHKIIGGAAVLIFLGGLIGWAAGKASDFVSIRVPAGAPIVVQPVPAQTALPPPAPAAVK